MLCRYRISFIMPCARFSKDHDQPDDSRHKADAPMLGAPTCGGTGEAGRADKESRPARLDY